MNLQNKQTLSEIGGTEFNIYFVCHRKLWFFSQDIQMEQNSDLVAIGRLIHENSFQREDKELEIDEAIKLDWFDSKRIIHEIKKSNAVEDAHIWQLKYYIWYLEQKGLKGIKGEIHYPTMRQKVYIELSDDDRIKIEDILQKINEIINLEKPSKVEKKKICNNCSYFELCWV